MAEIKPRYLVMVTASANNNKYYKQIPHGDSWTAEYGRVGSSPQRREYSMSDCFRLFLYFHIFSIQQC